MHISRTESETIVAFFAGTGLSIEKTQTGYVSGQDMGVKPSPSKKPVFDTRMMLLSQFFLTNDQAQFAYDGCHERGGGIFAFGVAEPAKHLYAKLKAMLKDNNKHIKLILDGHSRGCFSALLLAKEISEDPTLKDRIDIILNLIDPVPGNLKRMAKMDVANIATISRELKDLRHCNSIKEAYITVLEQEMSPAGFNVFIPKFPSATYLEVEYLPGLHDIQEGNEQSLLFKSSLLNKDQKYYVRNIGIFHLGIYKSLQLYLENNFKTPDMERIFQVLQHMHMTALSRLQGRTDKSSPEVLNAISLQNNIHKSLDDIAKKIEDRTIIQLTKNDLYDAVIKSQIMIYESILSDYKNTNKKVKSRQLHFEGEYKTVNPKNADFLNTRHFNLNKTISPDAKPMLAYHGKRVELKRKLGDQIDLFLSERLNVNLEHEYKTKSMGDVTKIVDEKITSFSLPLQNEIKRQLVEYQLNHQQLIHQWQREFDRFRPSSSDEEIVPSINIDDNIDRHFIINLKNMIESTDWKAGFAGGRKVDMMINGKLASKTLPIPVAEIYKLCGDAIQSNHNWANYLEAIALVGLKANNKPFTIFGLNKRDPETQKIYDVLKQAVFARQVEALKLHHKTAVIIAANSNLPKLIAKLERKLSGLSKTSADISVDLIEKYRGEMQKATNQLSSVDKDQILALSTLMDNLTMVIDSVITSLKNNSESDKLKNEEASSKINNK